MLVLYTDIAYYSTMDTDKSKALQKQKTEINDIYARVDAIGFEKKALWTEADVAETTLFKALQYGVKMRPATLLKLKKAIDELERRYNVMVEFIEMLLDLGITKRAIKKYCGKILKQKYIKKN